MFLILYPDHLTSLKAYIHSGRNHETYSSNNTRDRGRIDHR